VGVAKKKCKVAQSWWQAAARRRVSRKAQDRGATATPTATSPGHAQALLLPASDHAQRKPSNQRYAWQPVPVPVPEALQR